MSSSGTGTGSSSSVSSTGSASAAAGSSSSSSSSSGGKGKSKRSVTGRADSPELEPHYYAAAMEGSEPVALSDVDEAWLRKARVLPRGKRAVDRMLFCDMHNVFEVNGEVNAEVAAALRSAMDDGVRVVILSWVGFTPLPSVTSDITELVFGPGGLERGVPIITCTGNRIAKMALMAAAGRVMPGADMALLDDSDRNLEAAFSPSNSDMAAAQWGVALPLTGRYLLYVKKMSRRGPLPSKVYRKRVRKTVDSLDAVAAKCDDEQPGTADHVRALTRVVVDSARLVPRRLADDASIRTLKHVVRNRL